MEHYSKSHKILLVGEGDFSFSVCLATEFGSAKNMVATSLDSREMAISKYTRASPNLEKLEEMGCTIIHEVDATTMDTHPLLYFRRFDKIVFNFPHAQFIFGDECNPQQIQLHQELVSGFFWSAHDMLKKKGKIHLTHKTAHPFSEWAVEELANNAGLYLFEESPFIRSEYPGYINKRGYGRKCNKAFRVGQCSLYKFSADQQYSGLDLLTRRFEKIGIDTCSSFGGYP